jgi:hypothetical protein
MTQTEISAGKAALEAYAETQSWEAIFVPDADYQTATIDLIQAADASKDQSAAGRQTAGQAALRAALDSTGEGGMVSDEICAGGTAAVLSAVAELRMQKNK